jgi:hypothetical protein
MIILGTFLNHFEDESIPEGSNIHAQIPYWNHLIDNIIEYRKEDEEDYDIFMILLKYILKIF